MPAEREIIEIPEWGGFVFVRRLTGPEMLEGDTEGLFTSSAWLVVKGVVDANGKQVFSDNDVGWLKRKSAGAVRRVADAVLQQSGVGPDSYQARLEQMKTNPRLKFWHVLGQLFGCTTTEVAKRVSPAEFQDWMAFNEVAPMGEARMDFRFAILCMVIAGHSMGRKTPPTLEEFLRYFTTPEEEGGDEVSDQQQARTLKDELMGWQARRESQAGMRKGV